MKVEGEVLRLLEWIVAQAAHLLRVYLLCYDSPQR